MKKNNFNSPRSLSPISVASFVILCRWLDFGNFLPILWSSLKSLSPIMFARVVSLCWISLVCPGVSSVLDWSGLGGGTVSLLVSETRSERTLSSAGQVSCSVVPGRTRVPPTIPATRSHLTMITHDSTSLSSSLSDICVYVCVLSLIPSAGASNGTNFFNFPTKNNSLCRLLSCCWSDVVILLIVIVVRAAWRDGMWQGERVQT